MACVASVRCGPLPGRIGPRLPPFSVAARAGGGQAGNVAAMPAPGRRKTQEDHELAQQLDLARRMHGLTTAQLAKALYCSDRTVRRYLSGERRPPRDTVARWEEVCAAPPGTLISLYDRSTRGAPSASASSSTSASVEAVTDERATAPEQTTGSRTRGGRGVIVGLLAVVVVVVAVLALVAGQDGGSPTSDPGWDHKDPQESGCSRTPELLATVPISVDGRRIGRLELKGSTSCQTAWARLVLTAAQRPPYVVNAIRPVDGVRDSFTYRKSATIVFGGMLKHTNGCVRAEAIVKRSGARASTPCRR